MAEVRCPMCGKPNPEEAEVCIFCEARLKPLILSPAASEGDQNMPDWLRNLRSADQPEEDQPADDEKSAETLDWFSSPEELRAVEPPAPALDSPGGEEPVDWLADLGSLEEPLPEAEQAPSMAASEVESSEDWDSLSDWLDSLKQEKPDTAPETAAEDQLIAGEGDLELPDEPPLAEPIEPVSGDEKQSLADWLSGATIEAIPSEEWLSSIESAEQPDEALEAVEGVEPAEPGELPDWLTVLAGSIPEAIQEPITTEPEAEEISVASQDQAATDTEAPGAVDAESIFAEIPAEPTQELPDWLDQIDHTQEAMAGSVPAFALDDELAKLQAGEQAALEEATAEALSLPEWISELTAETAAEAPEVEAALEDAPDLAQAKLPDWLEAMRPVEAVAPEPVFLDQSDDHMESAGPLAGLRGVIPGEIGMLAQHKPPAYALKIPITDDQQARLATLQALVSGEGQEQPLPARPARTNQLVLRLIVFMLLVLVSVAALWINPQTPLPNPEQIAPEVFAVQQQVQSLGPNQPVLLVLDYEPGYVDEMNTVVMPVLDHMAARGAHLVFVSTSPTGPIIATGLAEWIGRQPAFANTGFENYTNLGFLPGGVNGIRAFALAPAQTLPRKLDGSPAWIGPLAKTVWSLDQFGLVVVASDDPEGARQWIEQAGPLLHNKTPFILLTSAQAGPMVQPYYAPPTGLVTGLVSGMSGGAEYYSATSRASVVPLYWGAFSLALNVVVVFIVLGGFVSLVSSSITTRKTQKGEENT